MRPLFRLEDTARRHPAVTLWFDARRGPLGAIARRRFEALRRCGDDVQEVLHDGQPTACVGGAAFAYVDAFTAHVNIGFFQGASLPDPKSLLEGSGKHMRHVKLRPDREVDEAALSALIHAAYTDVKRRLAVAQVGRRRRARDLGPAAPPGTQGGRRDRGRDRPAAPPDPPRRRRRPEPPGAPATRSRRRDGGPREPGRHGGRDLETLATRRGRWPCRDEASPRGALRKCGPGSMGASPDRPGSFGTSRKSAQHVERSARGSGSDRARGVSSGPSARVGRGRFRVLLDCRPPPAGGRRVPPPAATSMLDARSALERLREGNRRFASAQSAAPFASDPVRRAELLAGQEPFAIVLGCSDSRVPAELVFDQGFGDLFVIRVAGNVVAPSQVGSVEFAAWRFGTRLVVVLGHSQCGAVIATLEELTGHGTNATRGLRSIVDRVRPAVATVMETGRGKPLEALLRDAVRTNVRVSVDHLRHGSELLESLIESDGLAIVGAEYSLETGVVDFFDGPAWVR